MSDYKILEYDNLLKLYEGDINLRMNNYKSKKEELIADDGSLVDFANGHEYFGFHHVKGGWYFREWAPAADAMFLVGDFNNWNRFDHPMKALENGVFEIYLEGDDALYNGCKVKLLVIHEDDILERIPTYARRVVQDPETYLWAAEIVEDAKPFKWTDRSFKPEKVPYIYECHIGMAQEKYGIGSYTEFKENILPRVKEQGYNTIQVMAIMEHPYYGSFGYQVTNFFAASSRFGTPDELKDLINTAHKMGITVIMDVVHSHSAKNTNEGLNEFDGTEYQFFHAGEKGNHRAWDTKLFNYGKNEVIHFLLSNLKFWMTEYHFDGFRFDGVTSMIYQDHALGTSFDSYDKYFSMNTDTEAITYLQLANELIHEMNKNAITIAEDMSGMPGMCIPIKDGGIGFDYRLGMGVPDMWIKILKTVSDEQWDMWNIWHELTSRRYMEKTIGYAESHDQALVGDKTIIFWLCDQEMYWSMSKDIQNMTIDRGIALHKMIRLLTMSLAGEGYLNFMGNEFGHPEWIDFPREGNGWSYHYCRRQWSLADNKDLKYEWLNTFDKAMIKTAKQFDLLEGDTHNLWIQPGDKIMMYERGDLTFAFNFNPTKSFAGYYMPVSREGVYKVALSTDDTTFGGQNRISGETLYTTETHFDGRISILIYLPSRTAVVLERVGDAPKSEEPVKKTRSRAVGKRTKKVAAEVVVTPAASVAEEAPAEKPKRTRKTTAKKAEVVEAPVVEEAPAEKPKRTRKTVAKKAEVAETAAPVAEEAPAEKPKRTRKTAAKKAEAAETAAPVTEETPAEKPKRTRKTAAKKAEAVETAAPVTEEAPAEKPKRTRKTAAKKAEAAETAASVAEEAPAEKPKRTRKTTTKKEK